VPQGEISHGLPRLITSGNRILQSETMNPIVLRGVNRSGLEYSVPGPEGFLAAAGISQSEVEEIVYGWRARIIRIPLNQAWALNGCAGQSSENYLTALDQVIEWAASFGAYTILDLQWLDAATVYGHTPDGRANYVPPLPNPDTIALWAMLGQRYKHEPAVIFDLLNEPHDPLHDDENPRFLIDKSGQPYEAIVQSVGPEEWLPWASRLTNEIRRVHPESLILVSGLDWGYDLRTVDLDVGNVVYATHVYPHRPRRDWRRAFGRRASTAPVFVAEWGGRDGDLKWGARLTSVMNDLDLGWTAWSWADRPHLVANAQAADYQPTKFGSLVRSQLHASVWNTSQA